MNTLTKLAGLFQWLLENGSKMLRVRRDLSSQRWGCSQPAKNQFGYHVDDLLLKDVTFVFGYDKLGCGKAEAEGKPVHPNELQPDRSKARRIHYNRMTLKFYFERSDKPVSRVKYLWLDADGTSWAIE